mmetsp:Transcript_47241/g.143625  ORF Transcript_47241/g.143625 Transcript_47241/m.143625 type:complete len:210 (+) Transcript_47241:762-1391(+)
MPDPDAVVLRAAAQRDPAVPAAGLLDPEAVGGPARRRAVRVRVDRGPELRPAAGGADRPRLRAGPAGHGRRDFAGEEDGAPALRPQYRAALEGRVFGHGHVAGGRDEGGGAPVHRRLHLLPPHGVEQVPRLVRRGGGLAGAVLPPQLGAHGRVHPAAQPAHPPADAGPRRRGPPAHHAHARGPPRRDRQGQGVEAVRLHRPALHRLLDG